MNHNSVRDTRESVEEAWRRRRIEGQRYGTLEADEAFTPGQYARCVVAAASELAGAGLLSEAAMFHYMEQATAFQKNPGAATPKPDLSLEP